MAWRMASPIGFSRGAAGQGFQDHVYAVPLSNKSDGVAQSKGTACLLGMPSVLQAASPQFARLAYPSG